MTSIEIIEKIGAIFLSVCIILNGYIIKKKAGTWLIPSCLFSLFWFSFTFFPLIILYNVPINIYAQLFITVAVLLFSWSSAFFKWQIAYRLNLNKITPEKYYETSFLKTILITVILLSIIATILQVMAQGINFADIFNNPFDSAETYAKLRYSLELKNTAYNVISLITAYISVLLGGLIFSSSPKKNIKLLATLCFLPSLTIMFTQSAKGAFFLSIFLFLGGIFIVAHHKSYLKLLTYKNLKQALIVSIFIPFLITLSFMSRGLNNISNVSDFLDRTKKLFSSYTLAHLYAFSDWFGSFFGKPTVLEYDVSNNYYGHYTFNAITRYFNSDKKHIRGIYKEYYSYQEQMHSNVYTIFRGLIMDFGIIGSLLFMIINGLIIHKFYILFLKSNKPIFTTAFLIFMIGYFYTTFLASLLTWTVIPSAFVLFVLLLILNKHKFVR